MDMGNGSLGELSEAKYRELSEKQVKGLFSVGEEIEIRGSLFKIENVGSHYLTLKIMPMKFFKVI